MASAVLAPIAVVLVAGLEQELADWEDPAFVIAQARSRLHFVFPGEVGYVATGLKNVREAQVGAVILTGT